MDQEEATRRSQRVTGVANVAHDLMVVLTETRAQLRARTVRRTASRLAEECTTKLAGLATIEGTVRTVVTLIDNLTRLPPDGPPALTAAERWTAMSGKLGASFLDMPPRSRG